jgi:hypothetical protein
MTPKSRARDEIPQRCECRDGHACIRETAYARFGYICWPCRQEGVHNLIPMLDRILTRYGDRKVRRRVARHRQPETEQG